MARISGEGDSPRVLRPKNLLMQPLTPPSKSELRSSRPREERGEGEGPAAQPRHAAFVFASWIARQTRSDVSGMSISLMPYSDSASSTALTMQTRLPAQPASPQPLVPSGLDLAGEG